MLVEQGLAPSREKAKALILSGKVIVDGRKVEKAGTPTDPSSSLELTAPQAPFVGRGGEKLDGALAAFALDVEGVTALDVGASTGGFTDCLLQRGAARVYALDVGYGQLAWKLRQDPRVVVLDRMNIRTAAEGLIPERCGLAVIDASFISLKLVVPPTRSFLTAEGELVTLVKPQFEVGKGRVGKGGIVRDHELHREVLLQMVQFFTRTALDVKGWVESPLRGAEGNREFFFHLKCGGTGAENGEAEDQIRFWEPAPV